MTQLKAIVLDRLNTYRISRELIERFNAHCNQCGWDGPKRETAERALADLHEHVEQQDPHPSVPEFKEGDLWLL